MDTETLIHALIPSLNGLHLLSLHPQRGQPYTPPPHSKFTLFPTLPFELRQKIYYHTLPAPSSISLEAQILISDDTFGLYLTFTLPPLTPSHFTLPSGPKVNEPRMKYNRMLSLLSTNNESRAFYLSHFPITLPSGSHKQSRLYISPSEILQIKNLPVLFDNPLFHTAIAQNYRLQDWVSKLERIAVPIGAFIPSGGRMWPRAVVAGNGDGGEGKGRSFGRLEMFLVKCARLREVRALMWDGFWEAGLGEREERSCVESMRGYVGNVERELLRWKHEVDSSYTVPGFVVA